MKPVIEIKEVEIKNDCVVVVNNFTIEMIVEKVVGAYMGQWVYVGPLVDHCSSSRSC